jgi:predicted glycosyltransferase
MRLMVYSHDAFGLGNIRRMLAICEHLLTEIADLSILLLSGSPMLQGFRLPKRLDYIKLPCLNRGDSGDMAVKYLDLDLEQTVNLRSDLILSAATHYQPDVVLVDKKPYGIQGELTRTLDYLKDALPQTKLVLLLRDILDAPDRTIAEWEKVDFNRAIETFYDRIMVVGMPQVFDLRKAYKMPAAIAKKVDFCGYLRRPAGLKTIAQVQRELGLSAEDSLVLVTPGGGEDGYSLIESYLSGLALLPAQHRIKSLIICGPEMPKEEREALYRQAEAFPHVQMGEFAEDLMSYLAAADAVVSMGGYNTICEILSCAKRAIVIPRVKPSREQFLRAEKMTKLGLFKAIHPERLTPQLLIRTVLQQLDRDRLSPAIQLDLDALPRISQRLSSLAARPEIANKVSYIYGKTNRKTKSQRAMKTASTDSQTVKVG